MTDERRQAAGEWARKFADTPGQQADFFDAHLAGQECGEQRSAAEIAALREAVRMQYVLHNDKIESCVDGAGGGLLSHDAILAVRRALEEKA